MGTVDTDSPMEYGRLINKTDPEGYAFWTPYAEGVIGDCGIVRSDGQFVTLFNVFAEGTGFECLPTVEQQPTRVPVADDLAGWPMPADSAERRIRNENNIDVWRAQESSDWSVEVDVPIPAGELGFGFSISSSKGRAAFLAACGSTRRVETYLMDQVFPDYLKRNSKAIRARYSDRYDTGTLYILEGTTHATSWCRGLTRQQGRAMHGFVSVDPIPGVPAFRIGGGNGQMMSHPWMIAVGPSEQPPNNALHLIRARLTVHHSKRPRWLRGLLRQQVTVADKDSSRFAGIRSSILADEHTGGCSTLSGEPTGSDVSMQGNRVATPIASLSFGAMSPPDSVAGTPSSESEYSFDEPEVYAPNTVQQLLDIALEAHPEYDSLVVGWSVLQDFWDSCGHNSNYNEGLLAFDLEGCSDGGGREAVVHRIYLQPGLYLSAPELAEVPSDYPDNNSLESFLPGSVEGRQLRTTTPLRSGEDPEDYLQGPIFGTPAIRTSPEIAPWSVSLSELANGRDVQFRGSTSAPTSTSSTTDLLGTGTFEDASEARSFGERIRPADATLSAFNHRTQPSKSLGQLICPADNCLYTFSRSSDLKEHINAHLLCHWYRCPFCPKNYLMRDNALAHVSDCRFRHVGAVAGASDVPKEDFDARYPLLRIWSLGSHLPEFKTDGSGDAQMIDRDNPELVWECARGSHQITSTLPGVEEQDA